MTVDSQEICCRQACDRVCWGVQLRGTYGYQSEALNVARH